MIIDYSTPFSSAPPPSPGHLPPIAIPTHPHLSFLPSGASGPGLHPRDTHASSREGPVSAADVPSTQPEIAARSQRSVDVLEHESQTRQAERLKEHQRNTQTFRSYNRHIIAYEKFWEKLQTDRLADDPTWQVVPSFPVTAMKTAVFLEYESTRSKRKPNGQDTIEGSKLGRHHIQQVINSLEDWRKTNEYKYPTDQEARRPLRADNRIRTIEAGALRNERKRIDDSHALKSVGSSADTYTIDELRQLAWYGLKEFHGSASVFVGIRDRSMLLWGSASAFRGESSRILLWSDFFKSTVNLDASQELSAPVLVAIANNAKHNQHGRLDEFGALRHRFVELCPVGGLAFLFFALFHVLDIDHPSFVPDFTDKNFGQYGKREWYECAVFCAKDGPKKAMSYASHRSRLKLMHENNGISISKVTHATRVFAAQHARTNGASESGTKALGGWDEGGSFRHCYERTLPIDALLGVASFNATRPESYNLPRDSLDPPQALMAQIFPWVDEELAALDARFARDARCQDFALRNFLGVLRWFRTVLLQDAALLYTHNSTCAVWNYAPFNQPQFRSFASASTNIIIAAEQRARAAYEKLPERFAESLRGVTTGFAVDQHRYHEKLDTRLASLEDMVKTLASRQASAPTRSRKTRCATTPPLPPSPPPSALLPPPVFAFPNTGALPITPNITINFGDALAATLASSSTYQPRPVSPPSEPSSTSASAAFSPSNMYTTPAIPLDPRVVQELDLRTHYGDARFIAHQPWEWKRNELIPSYEFQTVHTIDDVWIEWDQGLNGFISVRELTTKWSTKWRSGSGPKRTEFSRRKTIVDFIHRLAGKPRWDIQRALQFLRERYASRTAHGFYRYLTEKQKAGEAEAWDAADAYV